jgi:hypothetical protein
MAAEKLLRRGYTDLFEYRDGFEAWQASGAPVVRGEPQTVEPAISDGVHAVDLANSFLQWTGRNILNKHHGRIGLKSGELEFLKGQLKIHLALLIVFVHSVRISGSSTLFS